MSVTHESRTQELSETVLNRGAISKSLTPIKVRCDECVRMTEFVKRRVNRTGKRLMGRSVILMFTSNVSNHQNTALHYRSDGLYCSTLYVPTLVLYFVGMNKIKYPTKDIAVQFY